MISYYMYDTNGIIVTTGACTEEEYSLQVQPGSSVTIAQGVADMNTEFVDIQGSGELSKKPVLPYTAHATQVLADGIDPLLIVVPDNLNIQVVICPVIENNSEKITDVITDGTLELSFDTPGEYSIQLIHPAYLPVEFTVEAISTT